jgi:hypothetical protein
VYDLRFFIQTISPIFFFQMTSAIRSVTDG